MRWTEITAMLPFPPTPADELEYPSSDGQPMAETDLHRDEMLAFFGSMQQRYRERPDVYVAGNLLFYYEQGNPKARFSPDAFVVFGVHKHQRRTYKLWEERAAPAFVLEFSSRGTWLEDAGNKKALCARLGVTEYFLCDPEADYLDPPLQGYRLVDGQYRAIAPRDDGSLQSETLGLWLRFDGEKLRSVDAATGDRVLRIEEWSDAAEDARSQVGAERQRAEQERQRAEQERQRAEQERLTSARAIQRVEEERLRADSADRRAEAERERAEAERERADRLEAELRRLKAQGDNG
jgi:Uma2 family endonuclease